MSDNSAGNVHEEAHTGPIKNPKQLLLAVAYSFILPVFIIIGLVYAVTTDFKPAAGSVDPERAVAQRIQKVGMVVIRDANRAPKSGEEVYKAQCSGCHLSGAIGAPKTGDTTAWAPRIKTGYDALLTAALKGKNAMPAQGGGNMSDLEIARGLVFMLNGSGGSFTEPAVPEVAAAAAPAAAN